MKKRFFLPCILAIILFSNTVYAYTPFYVAPAIPKVPDIDVKLSDDVKDAVNKAVQKQIEKMILDKPVVWHAECRTHANYSFCTITWCKVECATSYKVEITKPDGSKNTYNTSGNWLAVHSYRDDFISEMEGATARVKAYGEDETYSPWSDAVEIYCYK